MSIRIRAAELRRLAPKERAERLVELAKVVGTAPNGELTVIDAEIDERATRLGVDAKTIRQDVTSGRQRETWEMCQLLMLIQERERLGARSE